LYPCQLPENSSSAALCIVDSGISDAKSGRKLLAFAHSGGLRPPELASASEGGEYRSRIP
jgi:hypothetical protein